MAVQIEGTEQDVGGALLAGRTKREAQRFGDLGKRLVEQCAAVPCRDQNEEVVLTVRCRSEGIKLAALLNVNSFDLSDCPVFVPLSLTPKMTQSRLRLSLLGRFHLHHEPDLDFRSFRVWPHHHDPPPI